VPCLWARELLVRNGVDEQKLLLSRQGLASRDDKSSLIPTQRQAHSNTSAVRLAFLGRFSEEKGADLVIEAMRSLPHAKVCLDLYGSAQGISGERYAQKLQHLAEGDERLRFLPPLSNQEVVPTLRGYDALVVPSQWMETGPLVVLEAFAAGIPVIGSNLGGIAELVSHNLNGLLVTPDSVLDWATTLRGIAADLDLLMRLRNGITSPRLMDQVAVEMSALYRQLIRRSDRCLMTWENSVA